MHEHITFETLLDHQYFSPDFSPHPSIDYIKEELEKYKAHAQKKRKEDLDKKFDAKMKSTDDDI